MEMQPSQNLDSIWLTQTKFISPRPRLLDALHTAIKTHALTLLSAPAGYGKTTLLTWLVSSFPDVCVAWISLDEDDNDSAHFLAALIGAFHLITKPTIYLRTRLLARTDATANACDRRRALVTCGSLESSRKIIPLCSPHNTFY